MADAAEKNGKSPAEWTDLMSERFREAWSVLNISYDDFIRTTEPRHYETVQKFLSVIYENGYIYKDVYKGLYCVSCEDYYTLEASDNGNCPIHHRVLTEMEEENWFFQLSAFEDRLIEFYDTHPGFVTPETKRNEAYSFVKGGLKDISITRTSIKEILRFHCVWWPAMCMAADLEPVHHVHVNGWLLVGGEKLGKTMAAEGGVKVSDIEPIALSQEFGVDPLRYYLLRETALGNDGEFSLEGIAARYNTDLANNLGNLVARVAAVVSSKCAGVGPLPQIDSSLRAVADATTLKAAEAWENFAPQRALEVTFDLVGATNAYLETHAPWKMDPGSAVDAVMGDALEAIRLVTILISPAMPSVAEEIWRRIGLSGAPDAAPFDAVATWGLYPGGPVEKGASLFPRITSDQ